jgi:hypothetical protein
MLAVLLSRVALVPAMTLSRAVQEAVLLPEAAP